MQNKNLLFPAERALSGLRDSGIRNTASAVSEIIDNSVDADAKNISVLTLSLSDLHFNIKLGSSAVTSIVIVKLEDTMVNATGRTIST